MITPVQAVSNFILKRDDLYEWCGGRGAKARSISALIGHSYTKGLVTAGPLNSSQVGVVADIATYCKVPCTVFCPFGEEGPGIAHARELGACVIRQGGALAQLTTYAACHAEIQGETYIPLGVTCWPAVCAAIPAVSNIPKAARIVIAVGSGTMLCGILWGLMFSGLPIKEVCAVACLGEEFPTKTLSVYGPAGWKELVHFVPPADPQSIKDLPLNEAYEARALAYVRAGDLMWLLGGP